MIIGEIKEPRILKRIGEVVNIHGYIDDLKYDTRGKIAEVTIHFYGNRLPTKILDALEQYGYIEDIRTHTVEGLTYPVFYVDLKIQKQKA